MTEDTPTAHHSLVDLARKTIAVYLRTGALPDPEPTVSRDPEMRKPGAVFVSLKKEGQLRGCIGTIWPVRETLLEEVMENAVSAATRDPRFPPLTVEEMEGLDITVDVLTAPEPVRGPTDLDPARFGVIVRSRGRTGVLLPDLAGVDSVEAQLGIAMQKAGIAPDDEMEILRFEVVRHR